VRSRKKRSSWIQQRESRTFGGKSKKSGIKEIIKSGEEGVVTAINGLRRALHRGPAPNAQFQMKRMVCAYRACEVKEGREYIITFFKSHPVEALGKLPGRWFGSNKSHEEKDKLSSAGDNIKIATELRWTYNEGEEKGARLEEMPRC